MHVSFRGLRRVKTHSYKPRIKDKINSSARQTELRTIINAREGSEVKKSEWINTVDIDVRSENSKCIFVRYSKLASTNAEE